MQRAAIASADGCSDRIEELENLDRLPTARPDRISKGARGDFRVTTLRRKSFQYLGEFGEVCGKEEGPAPKLHQSPGVGKTAKKRVRSCLGNPQLGSVLA